MEGLEGERMQTAVSAMALFAPRLLRSPMVRSGKLGDELRERLAPSVSRSLLPPLLRLGLGSSSGGPPAFDA